MNHLQSIIDQAERHCEKRGFKLTSKRKQVLSGLLQSGRALSAYELVHYCETRFGKTLPAMSVYRMLDFLQQQGLVHKLDLANKYVACSHISCDHDHAFVQFLICGACQKVKEISIDKRLLYELQHNVKNAGYRFLGSQIEMSCLCDQCLSSGNAPAELLSA